MSYSADELLKASKEQRVYAAVLEKGMLAGLLIILITFAIYVFGVLKPYVPVEKLPTYWSMNVHEYLAAADVHQGWAWAGMLGYGDFLNFSGIAVLAGVTILCFLAVVPPLWKSGDKLYAAFAFLEAVILSVAASGMLGSGGH
jgi:hypothetical protein